MTAALVQPGTAQTSSEQQPATSSTVAYVYVSGSPSSGKYQINGYSAASNGTLTAISGSPFAANASYGMAVNAKWMFESDGFNLFSLSIASWQQWPEVGHPVLNRSTVPTRRTHR